MKPPAFDYVVARTVDDAVDQLNKRGAGAKIHAGGQSRTPTIKAKDFFVSYLQSAVEDGEVVTEVTLPGLPPNTGWGFEELCRRPGDFALTAVCALVTLDGNKVKEARIAMGGVGPTALRAPAAETLLKGQPLNQDTLNRAGEKAAAASDPSNDVHA